jgi:hypothetical protein
MKFLLSLISTIVLMTACVKQPLVEPCISTEKAVCTHNIVSSWQICPNPHTGKMEVVNVWVSTKIDTMSVCDTTDWLYNKRIWDAQWNNDLPKSITQKNSCGCN